RDVVADRVGALEARVEEDVLVFEVVERPLVLGAGEDVEQQLVECHGVTCYPTKCDRTSSTFASHCARVAASRLRRRSGSVLEGRRLNHQSPRSTVRPSRRSWSWPA